MNQAARNQAKRKNPLAIIFALLPSILFVCTNTRANTAETLEDTSDTDIEMHTTPDGHQFSFHHMTEARRAAISIAWKGGMAGVPNGKENIGFYGPFLMTNGGADGRKPDELAAEFEALDAGAHLYSEDDAIRGFIVAPTADLPKAAEIANGILARPTLDARWLARFKRRQTDGQLDARKQVNQQAWMTLRSLAISNPRYLQAWSWHPLENSETITIDDIENWHQSSISTDELTIAVAGKVTPEEAASAIDTGLSGLPETNKRKNFKPLTLDFDSQTVLVHQPDADKSYLLIAGSLPSQNHPDDLAHALAVGVLGQSKQSRLQKTVRNEQRASYGFIGGKYPFSKSHEVLALEGEVETEKLPNVIAAVEKAYKKFITKGIGVVEFPVAKRIMLKRSRSQMEKPSSIAYLMTESDLRGLPQSQALSLVSRAETLTRASVNQAISTNFPAITDMLRIIVTPNRNIIQADCVIEDFSEVASCE